MGKLGHRRNKVEPLFWDFALFWLTPDPARRPGITPPLYTKHVLIWSELVQFSAKTRFPLFFSSLGILFIYGLHKLVHLRCVFPDLRSSDADSDLGWMRVLM